MVVVDFDPVIIDDADLLCILRIEPERMTTTGESQHSVIVTIGAVNTPFAMRCQVIEHDALVFYFRGQEVLQGAVVRLWFVSRQMLASSDIALMIKVEMLTPGHGPPGYKLFDIETVGRISTAIVGQAAPYRAVQ